MGRITGRAPERKDCNENLIRIQNRFSTILIPQTVLGESFVKILERSRNLDYDIKEFTKLIIGLIDIKIHAPTLSREILKVTLDIRSETEYKIDYFDAMLVSYAICNDKDCAVFMIDRAVHQSVKIQNRINDCEHRVKLLDSV